MNYRQSLDFLFRRGNEVQGIHLGLQRIRAMMRAFANPQDKFAVLHVAGTNGKGSVAAMAASVLQHAGWKTALFTSPHLERIQERIRVNDGEISARRFAKLCSRIRRREEALLRQQLLDRRLTFFELVTACAFLHFAEEAADIAVVEVGLGGRLDATNIVRPQSCVITGVSYDHQNVLGNTLVKIAREKAGIVKPRVPVVSGCRTGEVRRVIAEHCRQMQAPLIEIDRHCAIRILGEKRGRFLMDLRTPHRVYRRLRLGLAGRHQIRNAAMAISALEALRTAPLSISAVRRGITSTRWPGRIDVYRARRWTLLDGAHNPEAALYLRDHLRREGFGELHFVFGAMRDKDLLGMGKLLFPMARSIHLTPVANSRTADPPAIAALHGRFQARMRLHSSARAALRAAWNECSRDGWVVVTGSLYLIGELLPLVRASEKSIRD